MDHPFGRAPAPRRGAAHGTAPGRPLPSTGEQRRVGGPAPLSRPSCTHEYLLVWGGELSDLGDGWEMYEDAQGNKFLREGEAELATRILNGMP
ncbi:hypothetical protein AB0N09_27895 [Streptomyces erythrochromogenes]|uniref:hypothetical protein n=1 Tax=Streptomyces erythrochromogenes TaxID=285574 RepID=UPI00341BA8BD